MTHLLVTNDYPPKHGGIQSYLGELWRRLPPGEAVVLTTPHDGAAAFDRAHPHRVVRTRQPVLVPEPWLRQRIVSLADEVDADLVVLDPALPVGALGPRLRRPYAVIVHGAEVTVPGRLPGLRGALRRVLRGASGVVAAGGYPAAEAERAAGRRLRIAVVPPGVDATRFAPIEPDRRAAVRERLGIPSDATCVLSVSRLVPRKGMDTLIEAGAALRRTHPALLVAIGGAGRDRSRLEALIDRTGAPARLLGRIPDEDLPEVYAAADIFAMLCRDRWRGLEQEGFGVVFLEAAAAGIPQIAGRSGGSAEAVIEGVTGLVVERPDRVEDVARAVDCLVADPGERAHMGARSRARVLDRHDHDRLAADLLAHLQRFARR